ncbi:1-acyl-sn-glycerol-3-phosphate acyltransferase [Psychroflexus maritimus]|uniref:Acyltransferase n=1 Tax=Psychroflexus maritimus TaxID=2714865 RepID=A0A967E303_9FLAO|nr:1-acyl-sn-glycerol-3-phosphate acyltransferase [Psychroflexus maritimus]NGZ90229.1 acyltransferase [Psychroflexus maritimus]
MRFLAIFIFKQLLGWKIIGRFNPSIKKSIVVVAPHTSWHDFYIGALARKILTTEINYIGKKELFKPPFGWYFKWMGGAPIDRSKNNNTVDQILEVFNKRETFRLAIAPEGTRKKVKDWKTGFYHIAKKASVPVIPVAFDYKLKQVVIHEPFTVLEGAQKTMEYLKKHYEGVEGKEKEKFEL